MLAGERPDLRGASVVELEGHHCHAARLQRCRELHAQSTRQRKAHRLERCSAHRPGIKCISAMHPSE